MLSRHRVPFCVFEWHADDQTSESGPDKFVVSGFGCNTLGSPCSISFVHLPSFLVRPDNRDLNGDIDLLFRTTASIIGRGSEGIHKTSSVVKGGFVRLVFSSKRVALNASLLFTDRGENRPPRLPYQISWWEDDLLGQALRTRGIPRDGWMVPMAPPVENTSAFGYHGGLHFNGLDGVMVLTDDCIPSV
jgi:hypothetical protein